MRRRSFVLFSIFCICWLGCMLALLTGKSGATSKPELRTDPPPPVAVVASPAETDTHERQTQARIQELARMEIQQQARERAAASMSTIRGALQFNLYDAWATLITTNLQTFESLRREAAETHNHQRMCTICDGRGALDHCIVCHDNGKCKVCRGAGKDGFDEVCPACMGTGKCFACGGSGRMTCPFCDDGAITFNAPRPPNRMPLL